VTYVFGHAILKLRLINASLINQYQNELLFNKCMKECRSVADCMFEELDPGCVCQLAVEAGQSLFTLLFSVLGIWKTFHNHNSHRKIERQS
jgi:hypothetical protein